MYFEVGIIPERLRNGRILKSFLNENLFCFYWILNLFLVTSFVILKSYHHYLHRLLLLMLSSIILKSTTMDHSSLIRQRCPLKCPRKNVSMFIRTILWISFYINFYYSISAHTLPLYHYKDKCTKFQLGTSWWGFPSVLSSRTPWEQR